MLSVDGGDTNSGFCNVSNGTATGRSRLDMSRQTMSLSTEGWHNICCHWPIKPRHVLYFTLCMHYLAEYVSYCIFFILDFFSLYTRVCGYLSVPMHTCVCDRACGTNVLTFTVPSLVALPPRAACRCPDSLQPSSANSAVRTPHPLDSQTRARPVHWLRSKPIRRFCRGSDSPRQTGSNRGIERWHKGMFTVTAQSKTSLSW